MSKFTIHDGKKSYAFDKDLKRKQYNSDLIRRMKNGDSLKSFDNSASWFPKRPVIKKDPLAIAILYKKKDRS
ncbi:MAG: hypothetical protein KA436_00380 [Oligoflexales bacterium]|nr:hypothetical protein [Oligoflexales bacterium]